MLNEYCSFLCVELLFKSWQDLLDLKYNSYPQERVSNPGFYLFTEFLIRVFFLVTRVVNPGLFFVQRDNCVSGYFTYFRVVDMGYFSCCQSC